MSPTRRSSDRRTDWLDKETPLLLRDWPNEDFRPWDARDFVVFDKTLWESTIVPAGGVHWCMKNHILGHDRGSVLSHALRCDLWTCADCARIKGYRHLHHLASRLELAPSAFIGTTTVAHWSTLRKALNRASVSKDSWWVSVRRDKGRIRFVTSAEPASGSAAITESEPQEAWAWARLNALQLPGLALPGKPVSWKRGSGPPTRQPTGVDWWDCLTASELERAMTEIDTRLLEAHGRPPYPARAVDQVGRSIVSAIRADRGISDWSAST